MVSRLDPVKDHLTLLRAVEIALGKVPDLRLVIVGEGPQRGMIENELLRKPDLSQRTLLAGDVRNVADWLNGFDVFVLPSLFIGKGIRILF